MRRSDWPDANRARSLRLSALRIYFPMSLLIEQLTN
jgi:hypothetical protein